MADSRSSEIRLDVTTDDNKVPTAIRWSASDAGISKLAGLCPERVERKGGPEHRPLDKDTLKK